MTDDADEHDDELLGFSITDELTEYEDLYDPAEESERAKGGRVATKPKKLSMGLFLGSNPTRSKRYDESEIGLHRRVLCRRYTNCLAWAAQQDFLGWTCDNCEIREVISREQQKDDLDGLCDFLLELNLLGRKKRNG